MSHDVSTALAMVRQQIAELDALATQTLHDLNTVAGTERVEKWKVRTVMLITNMVSEQQGQKYSSVQPGPSFTNDLVEEFTDLIECYRAPLSALAKQLTQTSVHPNGN
jgi:predicted metalloendopeptidase